MRWNFDLFRGANQFAFWFDERWNMSFPDVGKLEKIGLQRVDGRGFSFTTNGRFEYKYIEGDHVAIIGSDCGYDEEKPSWAWHVPFASLIWNARHMYHVVFLSELRSWEPPHESEAITPERKMIIERRIRAAMRLLVKRFKIV